MDFLLDHAPVIREKVVRATAHVPNHTVDVIFFDTKKTNFRMDEQ